jgi:amino acid transporter
VNPKHGTPGPAIWTIVISTFVVMAWTEAVPVVTSLSTVALYFAYVIPVILALKARLNGSKWHELAVWSLGRWGMAVNIVAIAYTAFISFVLVMPPSELAGKTLAGVLAVLLLVYLLEVRRKFKGPEWSHSQAASIGTDI